MRHLAIALVRLYQHALAPLYRGSCRFTPSCSEYAIEAFEKHGFVRGLTLTVRRLSRCHPFGAHGVDPVP
jgi:putative membrane protein insertion efficiency factor